MTKKLEALQQLTAVKAARPGRCVGPTCYITDIHSVIVLV